MDNSKVVYRKYILRQIADVKKDIDNPNTPVEFLDGLNQELNDYTNTLDCLNKQIGKLERCERFV